MTPGRSVKSPSKTPRVGSLTIDRLLKRSTNARTAPDCRSRSAPRSATLVKRAGVRVSVTSRDEVQEEKVDVLDFVVALLNRLLRDHDAGM